MHRGLTNVVLIAGCLAAAACWIVGLLAALSAATHRRPGVSWWSAYSFVFPAVTDWRKPADVLTETGQRLRRVSRRCALFFVLCAALTLGLVWLLSFAAR